MSLSTAPITWDLLSMSDGEVEVGPTLGGGGVGGVLFKTKVVSDNITGLLSLRVKIFSMWD